MKPKRKTNSQIENSNLNLSFSFRPSETFQYEINQTEGEIFSKNYPFGLRTNLEQIWTLKMTNFDEILIDFTDFHLDSEKDQLDLLIGKEKHFL